MVKSHLQLAKELQGRSYDSMIAHTIVFARYTYLAVETRNEQDPRTLGRLFLDLCDKMSDVRYADIIHRLLALLSQAMVQTWDEGMTIQEEELQHFLACLPSKLKARLAA
ncbi:hypothetical protein [Ferroacidibacillus organovorans]|nr:hypothetical protein [Ferroacidibacillus organovorans]